MTPNPLTILHVDMDAFYASVEQRNRPELRGQSVIVGGLGGRGVVSAACYKARQFGVHSALPMATARRLCPHGVFLPVRMQAYAQISRQIRDIFFAFTPLVEPLSLDEAFLDVRGCEGLFGPAPEIARRIKGRIQAETGLTASVGVAPNKFLAKLASDHGKPDGFIVLPPDQVEAFLAPLPVSRLWWASRASGGCTPWAFTPWASWQRCPRTSWSTTSARRAVTSGTAQGHDDRAVVPDREAKSLSTETTFAHDLGDRHVLRSWLLDLVDHLASRLPQEGLHARAVEVKMRASDFRTWTRSQVLPEATNLTDLLWQSAAEVFERSLARHMLPVRLLGVGASRLVRVGAVQGQLFEANLRARRTALDQTIDAIRGQFGMEAIQRGSLVDRPASEPTDQSEK